MSTMQCVVDAPELDAILSSA